MSNSNNTQKEPTRDKGGKGLGRRRRRGRNKIMTASVNATPIRCDPPWTQQLLNKKRKSALITTAKRRGCHVTKQMNKPEIVKLLRQYSDDYRAVTQPADDADNADNAGNEGDGDDDEDEKLEIVQSPKDPGFT